VLCQEAKKPEPGVTGVQEEAPNRPSTRKERYTLAKDYAINQMRGTQSLADTGTRTEHAAAIFFHNPE
jgi:hypothetical protein